MVFIFRAQHAIHPQPERPFTKRRRGQQTGGGGQGDFCLKAPAQIDPQHHQKVLIQQAIRFPALRLLFVIGGQRNQQLTVHIHCFVAKWRIAVQQKIVITVKAQRLTDLHRAKAIRMHLHPGIGCQQTHQGLHPLLGFTGLLQYAQQ
ncbi:hypothetical protein D3C86_1573690 [compost metagenome]